MVPHEPTTFCTTDCSNVNRKCPKIELYYSQSGSRVACFDTRLLTSNHAVGFRVFVHNSRNIPFQSISPYIHYILNSTLIDNNQQNLSTMNSRFILVIAFVFMAMVFTYADNVTVAEEVATTTQEAIKPANSTDSGSVNDSNGSNVVTTCTLSTFILLAIANINLW